MQTSRGLFLSAGTAALAAASIPTAVRAQPLEQISVGYVRTVTDAPLIVAEAKGFFRDVGLDITLTKFSSASFMVAPMSVGQLDIGAGAPVAGLYNAIGRGADLKIVANKCIDSRGYGFDKLVVRKELVDSGKYKGPADLRGLKFGRSGRGTSVGIQVRRLLKMGGLEYPKDIQLVDLDFPSQVGAIKSGGIDWTIAIEPFPTIMVNQGSGTVMMTDTQFYPDQEVADILYSGSFIKKRPAVAHKFMVAYMRGLRYYYESLKGGHITGKNGDEVVDILAKGLDQKPEMLRQITPSDVNPNGYVNMKSLVDDYATYKSIGLITNPVDMKSIVDMTYVNAALKELGVYKV